MTEKKLPYPEERMLEIGNQLPTPFHLYDGDAMRENARELYSAFSWAPGFTDFFAVKALPNINILRLLNSEGFGADCSSLPELIMARNAGIPADRIVFTSNDTPDEEFRAAYDMGVIINLDDIEHIEALEKAVGAFPERICFRFNPGPERTGNAIIGNPVEAKYGVTRAQIMDCYRIAREKGAREFGLHTMVASNELNPEYIVETARMVFTLAVDIYRELGIRISFVDLGGGVGIPYRPEEDRISFRYLGERIHELYDEIVVPSGLDPLKITFEMGRAITGPYGYLFTKVRHVTHKYKDYVGVDASMADLMRPALYGSYHHISVPGKQNLERDHIYDVTGSLCENNDKFAIDRALPEMEKGDLIVIHDTGAHGHAMGFNYNAKMRHAEYLKLDGKLLKIRREETYEDYIRTMLDVPEEV